ncbi:MAG: hypothetical protein LUE31_02265 [Lachnospiraceae bacterium]|nr:hypothetical protein [Lachnospiraceae bacterium]
MGLKYIEEDKSGTISGTVSEIKKSVNYLFQSMAGKDSLDSLLQRLGEYTDSIIAQRRDEGKEFQEGVCTLSVGADPDIVDIELFFVFENEQHVTETRRLKNQMSRSALTDEAFETIQTKNAMKFEITG